MGAAINYFIELLEINPDWVMILLLVLVVSCICPWKEIGKIEETEDEDGKKVFRIFRFK